jgi:hypothetical protein
MSVLAALVGFAVGVLLFRRGAGRRRERVDVYFDDGSMLSLANGQAERLLEIARTVL